MDLQKKYIDCRERHKKEEESRLQSQKQSREKPERIKSPAKEVPNVNRDLPSDDISLVEGKGSQADKAECESMGDDSDAQEKLLDYTLHDSKVEAEHMVAQETLMPMNLQSFNQAEAFRDETCLDQNESQELDSKLFIIEESKALERSFRDTLITPDAMIIDINTRTRTMSK
jgi:hypothetical protein